MKQPILFLAVLLCLGFISDKNPPLDAANIIGKWKLDKTFLDGVQDTGRREFRAMYYIFKEDNSVTEELIDWTKDDTIRYSATYAVSPKRKMLSVKDEGSSSKIRIQELTATRLVLITYFKRKGSPRITVADHYLKVEN